MGNSPEGNVLVVEDDPVQAVFLQVDLSDRGYTVVGPASWVEQALQLVADNQLDAAVLDVDISGYSVEPVADTLARRGVPFVFVAAGVPGRLRSKFQDAPVLSKPFCPEDLANLLAALVTGEGSEKRL